MQYPPNSFSTNNQSNSSAVYFFRYSIWLDSKLRLQLDPLLILEYFLWRKGHEYAISNHYDRHCLWEEVAQNKKLNKYNHTVIDQQFEFYKADGLTRFNASDPTLSACLFDITFSLWYICYKLSYFPCQYQVRLVPILKLDFFSMFKVVLYCTRCNWMSWCSLKTVTIETFLPIFQTHISNLTNSTVHAPI